MRGKRMTLKKKKKKRTMDNNNDSQLTMTMMTMMKKITTIEQFDRRETGRTRMTVTARDDRRR